MDERLEPLQTGGRSAGSIPATALGAEVRKRKANRAKQDSSSNFLISKRPRPSTLGLHSITGASLGTEEVQERRVDMISDRVRLLEQISWMNDEMRISEAWTTEAMEESREKDKEILELQKALGSGQPTSSRNSDSPSVVINPGSLACKFAQPNSIGTDQVKFANIEDHIAERGSVIGPLHRQTQSAHSLGSQSYSRMRTRGSLDSPSPISQDFH